MAFVSQAGPTYRVRSEITRSTNGRYGVFGLTNNIEASRMKESSVSFSSSSYYSTKKSRILNLDGAGVGIQRGYRAIVAASPPTEDAVIATDPLTKEDLVNYLASGCKPKEKWRIGTEHEKFGFEFGTLRPMKYEQIAELLNSIAERFDWERIMEHEYIIGLKQGQQSISLEPGGQFELSGAPLETLHQTCAEVNSHLYQVKAVAEEMGIGFLGIGFQPKWGIKDIPVMPKGRYEIMKNYMPKVGTLGLDMMFRTCTVQVNLDFSSEADMIRKFRAGLALHQLVRSTFPSLNFKVYIFREDTVINLISSSIREALENPLNYARNYLGDILDRCVDRVIYLDSDLVLADDIHKLWNITLTGSKIIGAPEYCHANFTTYFTDTFWSDPVLSRVFGSRKPCYFNTGVMVMDLLKWREGNYRKRIENWMEIQRRKRIYDLGSLPPFLLVFGGNVESIDHRWNQHGLGGDNVKGSCRSLHPGPVSLLHWSGKGKPWVRLDARKPCQVDYLWEPYDLYKHSNRVKTQHQSSMAYSPSTLVGYSTYL